MGDGDGDGDDEQRAEAVPNEIPIYCKYGYRSSSERDTERLRYGYRIGLEGDGK